MKRIRLFSCLILLVSAIPCGADPPSGDDSAAGKKSLADRIKAAAQRASEDSYLLEYKFHAGEEIRWKVLHLGTTETTIQGNTQQSKVRSASTKVWKVQDVDTDGNMTFVHSVSRVKMWQKVSGRPELNYDSESDATPPPEYMHVAKTVGVPISTVTISSSGKVVKRDKPSSQGSFGLGDIVMPLPSEPIRIGHRWTIPREIKVRRPDGRVKRIKTRVVYELKSVKTGIARISLNTEVLTPVNDPRIESQLMQQITKGEVKFDLDSGRIESRQIDWDETVLGFNGNDSLMKYLARFTEQLISSEQTAQTTAKKTR